MSTQFLSAGVQRPTDLVDQCIGKRVFIKCRGSREIQGILHAYDEHLNLMLSKVEETGPAVGAADTDKHVTRSIPLFWVRGDTIIAISPLKKK